MTTLTKTIALAGLVCGSLVLTPLAHADPPAAGSRVAQGQPAAKSSARAKRLERITKRMRGMRAWRLTEELSLDDATAGKLFAVIASFDQKLDAINRKAANLRRQIRAEMRKASPNKARIKQSIDQLLATYEQQYKLQRARFDECRKVLSPAQSGRLLLLLPRLDETIRKQVKRALTKSRARRKRRGADPIDELEKNPFRSRRGVDRRSRGDAEVVDPFAKPPPGQPKNKRSPAGDTMKNPFD